MVSTVHRNFKPEIIEEIQVVLGTDPDRDPSDPDLNLCKSDFRNLTLVMPIRVYVSSDPDQQLGPCLSDLWASIFESRRKVCGPPCFSSVAAKYAYGFTIFTPITMKDQHAELCNNYTEDYGYLK
uniref:Uncharacterized protein n=1 Tax=Romanomermis culicivorax TaxID=13658 RepID=A0A915JET1_ROMCU